MLFLVVMSFTALPASAQDDDVSCAGLTSTVKGLSASPDVLRPFTLESLANEAMRAHAACTGTPQRRGTVYAINQAAFALDHLQRYIEADSLVDIYFQRYADDDAYQEEGENAYFTQYRARLAAWRVRFATLRGDYTTASFTIGVAMAFTNALSLSRQINLRLDLAYLYEQEERYSRALGVDSFLVEIG